MKKYLILFLVFGCLGLLTVTNLVIGQTNNQIILNQVPYQTVYQGSFDNLVLDFSVITVRKDIVKAVSLENVNNADYIDDIKNLYLWRDHGQPGWQGTGVDQQLGHFLYSQSSKTWYLNGLTEVIDDRARFFISLEPFTVINQETKIRLQIPAALDKNNNMSFDVGDKGLFFDSGQVLPQAQNMTNDYFQVISNYDHDISGPKVVLTNLFDQQIINHDYYKIKGIVRDQGGSELNYLKIIINDQEADITELTDRGDSFYTWAYNWKVYQNGDYNISLKAKDSESNISTTPPIKVNVTKQQLDPYLSIVELDTWQIVNDGIDLAKMTVQLKDIKGSPIADRYIQIDNPDNNLYFNIPNNNSDQNGQIIAYIYSTNQGLHNFSVISDDQQIGHYALTVINNSVAHAGIQPGDLSKGPWPSVYYYAADGQRYVFPNELVYYTWYKDFSNVKTIDQEIMYKIPLAKPVTIRPGKFLLKVPTRPEVYAVDVWGTLRWYL